MPVPPRPESSADKNGHRRPSLTDTVAESLRDLAHAAQEQGDALKRTPDAEKGHRLRRGAQYLRDLADWHDAEKVSAGEDPVTTPAVGTANGTPYEGPTEEEAGDAGL